MHYEISLTDSYFGNSRLPSAVHHHVTRTATELSSASIIDMLRPGRRFDSDTRWTTPLVRRLVKARLGVWRFEGNLIALGTGRVLADIVGVDEAVLVSDESKSKSKSGAGAGVRMLTRAAFFYMEPGTERRMRTFRFRPTTPPRSVTPAVTRPSKLLVVHGDDGTLSLSRGRAQVPVPAPAAGGPLRAAFAYVARPMKKSKQAPARPGAVESFDWLMEKRPAMSWTRVSRCPSWYGGGMCLTRVAGTRVDGGWDKLEGRLRTWLGEVGRRRALEPSDAE